MDAHEFGIGSGVRKDAPSFSAFGNIGTVALLVEPTSDDKLVAAAARLENFDLVGRATNTLFPDGRYDAAVLTTGAMTGSDFCGGEVVAAAGERLSALAKKAAVRGLSGLEKLCSIPGSAGGAAAMNAGAFGAEFADLVKWVDALADGKRVRLSPSECGFGYRASIFCKDVIVLSVALKLTRSTPKNVEAEMRRAVAARAASQPSGKSLGSAFKRVDGISAGWYIERAGLKGRRVGGAEISRKHAGFIVNVGGGSASDYVSLMRQAQSEVKDHCGVVLEPEVTILGGDKF